VPNFEVQKPKRIFIIADFKENLPKSIRIERRRWPKGFLRLGHDVQQFSYRNIMMQCSPFPNKRIARYLAKKKTNDILIEQIRHYHPDIVFTCLEYLDSETLLRARDAAPHAVFVGRDADPYPEKKPERIAIAKQMDIVAITGAGSFLKIYKDAGVKCCAFIPCPCDPDIQRPYDVDEKWKSDIIFTGSAEHSKLPREGERYEIVKRLSKMHNARVYGCFGNSTVDGIEAFYAISGAKIALSVNIVNDVRLYHSDRLVNCLACGTFTLAKRVPDTNLLFEDSVHLKYFDSADEFFQLADWYLQHEQERERIATAGMQRAYTEFNCKKIAQCVLDLIEKGKYDAPWAEII
jgi:spore maturation protein CgeB